MKRAASRVVSRSGRPPTVADEAYPGGELNSEMLKQIAAAAGFKDEWQVNIWEKKSQRGSIGRQAQIPGYWAPATPAQADQAAPPCRIARRHHQHHSRGCAAARLRPSDGPGCVPYSIAG